MGKNFFFDLNGHAVVFGASGDIGRAIALRLAKDGVKWLSFSYGGNKAAAEELAGTLQGLGVGTYFESLNLSDQPAVDAFLASAVAAQGGEEIRYVVNAVGISPNKNLLEQTLESTGPGDDKGWREVFEVNVFGNFIAIRSAVKRMRDKGMKGSIVLITSTNGIDSYSQVSTHYDSSKTSQWMTGRIISEFFAKTGIRVNGIAPGWVKTKMNDSLPEDEREVETKRIGMGRWAEPHEIAEPTAYFLCDGASYICGVNLKVDGCYRA